MSAFEGSPPSDPSREAAASSAPPSAAESNVVEANVVEANVAEARVAEAVIPPPGETRRLSAWRTRRLAKLARRESRRVLRWYGRKLAPELRAELESRLAALEVALAHRDLPSIARTTDALAELFSGPLAHTRKSAVREYLEQALVAVAIALFVRAVFVEAFQIPSASMAPTLEVGDYIFVNKLVYGLRVPFTTEPPRKLWELRGPKVGEVIVFLYPSQPGEEYIKRVVATAGDTVRFRHGQVYVRRSGNAEFERFPRRWIGRQRYCHLDEKSGRWTLREAELFEEELGGKTVRVLGETTPPHKGWEGALRRTRALLRGTGAPNEVEAVGDTFGPIPQGHVFVLGDNRDNSHDSRYFGTVPTAYVTGRAMGTWLSRGGKVEERCEVGVRWERTFPRMHGIE